MTETRGKAASDRAYEIFIDELTLERVAQGVVGFNQLVTKLPGVYPTIAFRSLERLAAARKIPKQILTQAGWQSGQECDAVLEEPSQHRIVLPVEHPLDYDWRFTDAAADRLLAHCLKLTQPDEAVAMIGCPTILRQAVESDYPRSLSLIDKNQVMTERLMTVAPAATVIRRDVTREPVPFLSAAIVILDPPWYEDYVRPFIRAACRLSALGAYLLISLPPIGTRPGIESDRRRIFHWAQEEMGLTLVSVEKAALAYLAPPFELNALRAEGLHQVLPEWRRGDLFIFRREREVTERPEIQHWEKGDPEYSWAEENVSGMRIRIRGQASAKFENPLLLPVVNGDIIPSVSRRDVRRRLADVWTSGNRIFACHGRHILRAILQAIATGRSPEQEVATHLKRHLLVCEVELISRSVCQVKEIARLERKEYLLQRPAA